MTRTYGPATPTEADKARATMHTAAVIADPSASPMDRYRAAEAEQATYVAYEHAHPGRAAEREELEAGS